MRNPNEYTVLVLDSGEVVEACTECSGAIRTSAFDQNRVPMDVVLDVRRRTMYQEDDGV